jgi:hypothetical protein
VSGPVKRPSNRPLTRHPGRRAATREQPLLSRVGAAAAAFVRSLPDHRLLDRVVRGRAWIPILGVLLAGIVATQVEVLKLGASMGRWVSRTAALTSRNQALQASVAALSDGQRIERLAAQMGMVMPAPTDVNFAPLHPRGGIRLALRRIQAPNATQFLAALAASQAAAQAQAAPTVPAMPTTPSALSTTAATQSTVTPAAGTTTAAPPSNTAPASTATTPATTGQTVTSTQPAASTTQPTGAASLPSGGAAQTGG